MIINDVFVDLVGFGGVKRIAPPGGYSNGPVMLCYVIRAAANK